MHRIVSIVLVLATLGNGSALAAEAARTQVMLFATYHFSNPGKDLNNVKAVDVLTADRQREIGAVITSLARFAPTQVAVECRPCSDWYERNLAICARLLQHVQPGDRVVAFYGQGHIYLLRQCLREQPSVQLIDPLSYLAGTW